MKKSLTYIILAYCALAFLLLSCAGHTGGQGGVGLTGPSGATGPQGTPGLVGPQGPAGLAGTQFEFVQLCPGTTSYPNVFIELGMCVNGDLYGVYSANGGFYTYFPPGHYSSNAIGSACNLVIGPNCSVTH